MGKKTKVVLVLDRSFSMEDTKDSTIDAINEYVQSLKNDEGLVMTQVQFDEYPTRGYSNFKVAIDTVWDEVPIADVPKLDRETYKPRGNTPLYDAIGHTIKATKGKRVLFLIMTDGLENASREFNQEKVFRLIKERKKKGWTFVFMGANQDSYAVGGAMGISQLNTVNYTQGQEQNLMETVTGGTRTYLANAAAASEEFFEEEK